MINKYNIKIKSLILILVMINTILFGFVFVNASMILNNSELNTSSNRLILDLGTSVGTGTQQRYTWYSRSYIEDGDGYTFSALNRLNASQDKPYDYNVFGIDFKSSTNDQYFNLFGRQTPIGTDSGPGFSGRLFDRVPMRSDYKFIFQYISGNLEFDPDSNGNITMILGPYTLQYNNSVSTFPDENNPILELYFDNEDIAYTPLWFNIDYPFNTSTDKYGFIGEYKFKLGIVPRDEVVTDLSPIPFITDIYNDVWDVESDTLITTTSYPNGINSEYYSTHNPLDSPLKFITRSYSQDKVLYSEDFSFGTLLTSQYTNNSFTSNSTTIPVVMTYNNARNSGSYPIDGSGITFQNNTSYIEFTLPSGLSYFSFEYRKAFTSNESRSFIVYINNVEYEIDAFGNNQGASDTIHTFMHSGDYSTPTNIKIQNTGAQTTLSNIAWVTRAADFHDTTKFIGYYEQDVLFNGDYNEWGIKEVYDVSTDGTDPYLTDVIWASPEYNAFIFGNFKYGDSQFISKEIITSAIYTPSYTPLITWRPTFNNGLWVYNFVYNQYYTDNPVNYDFNVFNESSLSSTNILFNFTLIDANNPPPDIDPFPIPDPNNPDIPVVPDSIIVNYYIPDYLSDELFAYRSISIKSDGPTYAPFIEPPLPNDSNLNDNEYYVFTHYEIYGGIYNGLTFLFDDMDINLFADNNKLNLIARFDIHEYPIIDINFYATNLNTNNIDLYDTVSVWNNPKIDITAYSLPDPNDWYLYFYTYNDPVKYDGYIDDFWFEIQSGLFKGTIVDLFAGAPLNGYIVDNKVDVILVVKAVIDPNIPGGSGGSGGTTPPIIVPPPDYVPPTGVNSILLIIFNLFGLNSPVGFVLALVIISIAVVVITVIYKVHIFFPIVVIGALVILFTYLQLIPTYLTITITLALVFIIIINLKRSD